MAHPIPAHIDAHIAAKPKNANSRVWPWLTLASTALMSACATAPSYQPVEGADAATLRVRLLIPADYRPFLLGYDFRSTVGVQSVNGTACSEPATVPALRLYRGATPPVPGPQAAPGRPAMTRPTRTQSVRRAQAAFI